MLLVAAGIMTFSSCKKDEPKQLPEKVTVSGQVTDKDGHPWVGVHIQMSYNTFMYPSMDLGEAIYTDENGHYEIEFKPETGHSYRVNFKIVKDGYEYSHHYYADPWIAEQEYNVVLKKSGE